MNLIENNLYRYFYKILIIKNMKYVWYIIFRLIKYRECFVWFILYCLIKDSVILEYGFDFG